jgi:hypothetical protein
MSTVENTNFWSGGAAAFHVGIVQSIQWAQLSKTVQYQFCRNGCHGGWRGISDAQLLFENVIPRQAKMFGENYLREWMATRDFGHIQAHANGGGYQATNIVMEKAALNRARGGRDMTPKEISRAQANGVMTPLTSGQFFSKVAGNAAKGAVAGAVFMGGESALRNIWNAADGEISWEKAAWNIVGDASRGAIWGGGIAAGTTVLCAAGVSMGALVPLMTVVGAVSTTWSMGSFIWGKFFSDNPKISLLVRPKIGELLVIPKLLKLILPEEAKLEIPERKFIIFPPQNPLVTSLKLMGSVAG